MDIFLLYQYIITAILLLVLLNYLLNNILFKDSSRFKLPQHIINNSPLISVLIPARNEEENIKKCLLSLTKQDYKNIEIIVLNDNSTDNTGKIVAELSKKDSRIKLYNGKKLKKGWMGKNYACHQLAGYARGDYLLFTDADTIHFPDSISSALACLLNYKLGALSVFAKQIMVTVHERMIVPFGSYMILCFLPLFLVERSKNPLFCAAIGQFMLFKKDVYEKIGGHESIKSEVLEDIKISKRVKKYGYKFMIFDGRNNLYCRMYKNFSEVVRGYSKVLFAAFDYKIYAVLIVLVLFPAVFLFPFIMFPLGIIFEWPTIIMRLVILQVTIILLTKIIFSIRFKCKAADILLYPFSIVYLMLIAINSICSALIGEGVSWKGRIYDVRNKDEVILVNDSDCE